VRREDSQVPEKYSQPEIEGWQQGEQRRTAKHSRSSPTEIEEWKQSEERRTAKYSRSTHKLKLRVAAE
jgi:hypothetical protein